MERTGNLEVLRNALRLKNGNAFDRTGKRIRLMCLWLGGVMRGAIGGGASEAVQEAGLANVASVHGAVSAGGPTALALVQNKAHLTVPVYEGLADDGILALGFRERKLELGALAERLAPILCDEIVRGLRERLYVVATKPDGTAKLLDVKNAIPGCRAAITASMAMPRFFRFVKVNGFELCDGAWADFQDALNMLLQLRPTDVLVFANSPRNPDFFERAGYAWGNWTSPATTPILQKRESRMDADLESALQRLLQTNAVRTLVFRPKATDGFFPWTTHPRIVRKAANQMKSFVEGSLEDAVLGKA